MRLIPGLFLFVLITGYAVARENIVADIIFKFYYGSTMAEVNDIYLNGGSSLVTSPGFNLASPTVFYIHGYEETIEFESIRLVIPTYLEMFPDSNIILIDWSNMGGGVYLTNAAPNTILVAEAVANQINYMVRLGLNPSTVHIVGHSLGAQVAGRLGKFLTNDYNITIDRITGLDPAFSGFYPGIYIEHIDKTSAKKVDIIHTDAGVHGGPVHTGIADFWPNAGVRPQPGCPLKAVPETPQDFCSHWMSWRFWAESLRTPKAFPAVQYPTYTQFKLLSNLKNKPYNYMGVAADASKYGDFYLQTSESSPFGKGAAGAVAQPG